jgi:arylsulfatase A-like enzyme
MGDVFLERARAWLGSHIADNGDQPFFLYYPSHLIHVPRAPHPRFHGKSELGYRGDAMVELDASVGEFRQMLEELGVADKTMIIFSSDNGPVYDDGYDDGTTVHTSTEEADRGHDGSGPYRGGKYQVYEGGTRVPLIVHWPDRIKPGVSPALVSHTDFLASFAEFFGIEIPEGSAPDSQNAMEALLGEDTTGNDYQIEEHANQLALRHGDWKLIMRPPGQREEETGDRFELYNLTEDIGEQGNIIDQHPDIAEEMKDILIRIREGAQVRETVMGL